MALDFVLTETEVRVLGSLIEKKVTTPEYYPLSLNALKNACNQTSNRDPVVSYDEATVADALEQLKQKNMVLQHNIGRAPKFEELFLKVTRFMGPETAVLCTLMLRGPQTEGEIRNRAERLHSFENTEAATKTIQTLQEWGYVTLLPRQAGKKEQRWAHLLAGQPDIPKEEKPAIARSVVSDFVTDHKAVKELQAGVQSLRQELDEVKQALLDLKQAFLDFKAQF